MLPVLGELTGVVSEVVATLMVGLVAGVAGLMTSLRVIARVSPGLTTPAELLKMLQVRTGGLTPAAVLLQKFPTWVPLSRMSKPKIGVMSVPLGKVIVNWLPAAPERPPVVEVLKPT